MLLVVLLLVVLLLEQRQDLSGSGLCSGLCSKCGRDHPSATKIATVGKAPAAVNRIAVSGREACGQATGKARLHASRCPVSA